MEDYIPKNVSGNFSLLDSMPIITCSGIRQGKVAMEITDKSCCSTKKLYNHAVKRLAFGVKTMP